MKNQTAFITKDGLSDLDLIAAARDMYEALESVLSAVGAKPPAQYIALSKAALAKVRGQS